MILFVDETENDDYFIVTGLLLNSREDAALSYKKFKNKINRMPFAKKDKAKVFTEFKSTLLDRHYQKVKIRMIESLGEVDRHIIYSCYIKKSPRFPQTYKEDVYISLLSNIVLGIKEDISIIFDTFNKPEFERRIADRIYLYSNVQAIMPRDSQLEPGLQFVDNMCSIIRLNLSGQDKYNFFEMIKDWVIEV